jgi:hypothetical protein
MVYAGKSDIQVKGKQIRTDQYNWTPVNGVCLTAVVGHSQMTTHSPVHWVEDFGVGLKSGVSKWLAERRSPKIHTTCHWWQTYILKKVGDSRLGQLGLRNILEMDVLCQPKPDPGFAFVHFRSMPT